MISTEREDRRQEARDQTFLTIELWLFRKYAVKSAVNWKLLGQDSWAAFRERNWEFLHPEAGIQAAAKACRGEGLRRKPFSFWTQRLRKCIDVGKKVKSTLELQERKVQ